MLDSPTLFRAARLVAALGALAIVATLQMTLAPGLLGRARHLLSSARLQVTAALLLLAVFAGLLITNTAFPGYLDQAEPNIASVAWLVRNGAPLYHTFDSASRYSLLYGPGAYLPYSAGLWAGGGSALSVKCVVLLANVVMLYFLWRIARSFVDTPRALVALCVILLFILLPRPNHYLFQARADILILAATVIALFGATRPAGFGGPAALALGTAFIIDTKATAVIYALPLFALVLQRRGFRTAFIAGVATPAVAFLPFLLPNVSLNQYAQWLRSATGHPSSMADLKSTLLTLPILLAPLLLVAGPAPWRDQGLMTWLRKNVLVVLAMLFCMTLAVLASTRIGAGSHHLLPFIPLLGFLYMELRQASNGYVSRAWPRLSFYAGAGLAIVVVARVAGGLVEICAPWRFWNDAIEVRNELRSAMARHGAGKVGMGYGDRPDLLTYFRPDLVFAGQRLVIDDVALSDMSMDGMGIPAATVTALDDCATPVWLIPRGQQPFMEPSLFAGYYPDLVAHDPLFSAAFREAFSSRYRKSDSTGHFDVWVCAPGATRTTP